MFTAKRSLAAGLAIAAAGFPAAAQAAQIVQPELPLAPVASQPAISHQLATTHQLDQLQGNVRHWFAAHRGVVLPAGPSVSLPQAGSGFQWGDAGIGAAGAVVLLGAGALGTGMTRRRRMQRPATS